MGMVASGIVEALQQVAIFQGLAAHQLEALAEHSERVKFQADEHITRAGEAGSGAYVLVTGAAERTAEDGKFEQPEPVAPGSIIGQLAMLIEHSYGSTVVARDRVLCLKITRAGVQAQMANDPSLAQHFAQHVTQRLLAVAQELKDIDALLEARKLGLDRPRLALAPPAEAALAAAAGQG